MEEEENHEENGRKNSRMKKMDEFEDLGKEKVLNEGQNEIEDSDFLRQMGIGYEDNGIQLTQISEITANIHGDSAIQHKEMASKHCQQDVWEREFQDNTLSYYNFESHLVNPSYNEEGTSTGTVDYNSYALEKQAMEMNVSIQQEQEMQSTSKQNLELNPESFYTFQSYKGMLYATHVFK